MAQKIKVSRFNSSADDPTKKGRIAVLIVCGLVILIAGFTFGRATSSNSGSSLNANKESGIGKTRTGAGPFNTKTVIPTEFSHSTKGAVAAASTYISSSPRLFMLKESAFNLVLLSISSQEYGPQLKDAVMSSRSAAQQAIADDPNMFYREIPLGYSVISEEKDKVQVAVWTMNMVVARPALNGNTRSNLHNMTLIWQDGDWKIDLWTNSPGPTPRWQSETQPLSVDDFIKSISPFTGGYDYAPSF